jgi:preprotein translocase subunit SecG
MWSVRGRIDRNGAHDVIVTMAMLLLLLLLLRRGEEAGAKQSLAAAVQVVSAACGAAVGLWLWTLFAPLLLIRCL